MTDDQLRTMIATLERGTPGYEVRLGTNFGPYEAAPLSPNRLERVARGERTVVVYHHGRRTARLTATREQALRLERAGAQPASVEKAGAEATP
jgi:hypothetical protein